MTNGISSDSFSEFKGFINTQNGLFWKAGDAMLLLDAGAVVDCNLAALKLFQTSRNRIAELCIENLCPPRQPDGQESAAAVREYIRHAADGETMRYRWQFSRADGVVFDSDVTLNRVGENAEDLQLAVIRELSEIPAFAEMEELLHARTAQLDSVNQELDAISYSVSHDLRAAVLGIAACSQIVVQDFADSLTEEGRQWLHHIYNDSVQLDHFTEGLIELSRSSRKPLEPEDLDLTAMAREIAFDLNAEYSGRNVEFHVCDDMRARGDATLVRTLLRNLLDNAWKFTAKSINGRVEFGCLPCDPSCRSRVFYVRDNGVGFDTAHADRLFVPFQRLHATAPGPGKGVRLAEVRRIAHRHGGKTWADGAPGAGATFFFTLDGRLN